MANQSTVLRRDDVRAAALRVQQLASRGDAVHPANVYYWPAFDRYCPRADLKRLDALSQLRELPEAPKTIWTIQETTAAPLSIDGYLPVSTWPGQGVKLLRYEVAR
jgi:hypothetical protein